MHNIQIIVFITLCSYIAIHNHTLILCISYNMGMSALLDLYARSPRADGMHIRQSMSAHVMTNNNYVTLLTLLKSAQTIIESAHSTYIKN